MKTKIAAALALGLGVSTAVAAQQLHPLEVVFEGDGCMPAAVESADNSCDPNEPDPPNMACRANDAVVHWTPLSRIKEIGKKDDSSGGADLVGCIPNNGLNVYQCTLKGQRGQSVEYYVEGQGPDEEMQGPGGSNNRCKLDPVIRVK